MDTKGALTVLGSMQISTLARQLKHGGEELGAGLAAPFAVIGYKGGKWSVRHRGNSNPLSVKSADGRFDVPVPFLDMVILYAAPHNSKIFYEKNYQDGDDNPPDCWSTDGLKPDTAAPKKQHPTCDGCRHNEFGSRLNAATGARGKACGDFRRLAVTTYPDIENAIMGGPMLLRVPPASLGVMAEYGAFLKANAVPYQAVVTRFGFDAKEAFPKFTMAPLVALTDNEMMRVVDMEKHPLVDRIVQQQVENMVAQPGSEQGVNRTAPEAGSTAQSDPGPMPEHLRRGNGAAKPVTNSEPVRPSGEPVTSGNPFAAAAAATQQPSYQAPQTATGSFPPSGAAQAGPVAQAAPAATAAPAQAVPQETLTPEQVRIRELEAQLAAAKASQPRKRRSQPVAPSTVAEAAPAPVQAAPPGEAIVEDDEPEDDPALAAINDRLSRVAT